MQKAKVGEEKKMEYGTIANFNNINQLLGIADSPEEKQHEDETVIKTNS